MKLVRILVIAILLLFYGYFFGYPSMSRFFDMGVTITRTFEKRSIIETPGEVFFVIGIFIANSKISF